MKDYRQAPLPFQGQKRRFLNDFRQQLKKFPPKATYVDLFGGSGLLSHTVKDEYPEAQVVWNDYDSFQLRLNHIASTNLLLADIRFIVKDCLPDKKIPENVKSNIIMRIQREVGFVDFITLSGSLLFSGKYSKNLLDFKKETFYNRIKQSDYNATGYLEGVQRVSMDYKQLYNQYKNTQNVVFLLDPPYLSTDSSSYNSNGYWRLTDYLDVLDCLSNNHYFYFTSNKSSIIELCEWMSTRTDFENPFENAWKSTVSGSVNYSASYQDIMVYKLEK